MKLNNIKYFLIAFVLLSLPAHAMTLEEALISAYKTNPNIIGEKSRLAATKENLEQAKAGYLPSVSLEVSKFDAEIDFGSGEPTDRAPLYGAVIVTQPIFKGWKTDAQNARVKNEIAAGLAAIQDVNQEIFLRTVRAYTDVIRNKAVYDLTIKNEDRLKQQLDATLARRSVGEVTKTDVSQAESRFSQATAEKLRAKGDLETSYSAFERVVGRAPQDLQPPLMNFPLPQSLAEATQIALQGNPRVLQLMAEEKSAQERIREARGEMLPEVDVVGTYETSHDNSNAGHDYDEWELKAQLRMPLYQGGSLASRERQSKHNADLSVQRVLEGRRAATDDTASSWQAWQTAIAQIKAFKAAVRSAELAYDGVQQEAKVGSRTVLDVLDAQQELLQAEVNLVRASREEIVQRFELLAVMGRLTPEYIGLPVLEDYLSQEEVQESLWNNLTNWSVFGEDE